MTAIEAGEIDAINDAIRDLNAAINELFLDPPDASEPQARAILALDALGQARRRLARNLVREMIATGVLNFRVGQLVFAVRQGRTAVDILDIGAVPPSMMKWAPDQGAIRNYIREHPTTNWGVLREGEPYLEIRAKV